MLSDHKSLGAPSSCEGRGRFASRDGGQGYGLLCFLLLVTTGPAVRAESPSLAFDFGRTAECRVVTPEENDAIDADEKIIELQLRVSLHLLSGSIDQVQEIRIEVVDCDDSMRIHSFSPSTRLESGLSEDIQWTKTTETGKSLGGSLGGEAPVSLAGVVAHITPTLNGGLSHREIVTETQKRVAPKYAVVTSGTIQQEHGVVFKLRRSPQTSLEGVHELSVRFIVPEKWRGDVVRVCCQAIGKEKFLWIKQQATWAAVCHPVVLYLAGDSEARQAAQRQARRSAPLEHQSH